MNEMPKTVGGLLQDILPPAAVRKRPKWPLVIGVCSILFGGMPTLSLLICLVMAVAGKGPLLEPLKLQGFVLGVTIAFGIYFFAMFFLIFLGGIGLVYRRRWGRLLLLVYSWACVGVLLAYLAMWVLSGVTWHYADFGDFATKAWHGIAPWWRWMVYPTFLILWFLRPSVRKQVREW